MTPAARRKEIRHANLGLLIEEFGSLAEVARLAQTSEKYLWQIMNRVVQRNSARSVGDALAEKLEIKCNKPAGWMDEDHRTEAPASMVAEATKTYNVPPRLSAEALRVAHMWDALPEDVRQNLYGMIEFSYSAAGMMPPADVPKQATAGKK